MPYPFKVACPNCNAKLTVAKPIARGRCRKCGSTIEIQPPADSGPDLQYNGSAGPGSPAGEACEREPVAAARRRRWWLWCTAAVLCACGALSVGYFWLAWQQQPAPIVVINVDDSKQGDLVTPVPPSVVVVSEEEPFDADAFGQLDSLLLSASGLSGSWLTGAGSMAHSTYAPPPCEHHGPPPSDAPAYPMEPVPGGPGMASDHGIELITFGGKDLGPISPPPKTFKMKKFKLPDMYGKPVPDAETDLTTYGLVSHNVYPTDGPTKGIVVVTNPPRGKAVNYGDRVELTPGGIVPDLTKGTIKDAVVVLNAERFRPDYDEGVTNTFPVTYQSPQPGELHAWGSNVAFVSAATMPYVEKLSISEATNILRREEIAFVWWSEKYNSNNWPDDLICSQSIPSGNLVIRGTRHLDQYPKLALRLWAGVRVPNITGMDGDSAKRMLDDRGIEYVPTIRKDERRTEKQFVGYHWRNQMLNRQAVAMLLPSSNRNAVDVNLGMANSQAKGMLVQIRRQDPQSGYRDEYTRRWEHREEGKQFVERQQPPAGEILCRGGKRKLEVYVVQPVVRIEFWRRVPIQQDGNQGFGGGGTGGGGLGGGGTNSQQSGGGFF